MKPNKPYLLRGYTPSQDDVICGKGDHSFQHLGNILFRRVIEDNVKKYCASTSREEKSIVFADVIETVRSRNTATSASATSTGRTPGARFIRFDYAKQAWYDLGEQAIKQKIGQTIRETVYQRDPEKRKTKALRRAKNYNARRLARSTRKNQHFQSFPKMESNFRTLEVSDTTHSSVAILSPEVPSTRCKSAPPIEGMVEKAKLPRHAGSNTTMYLADIALASLAPALNSTSSSDWFADTEFEAGPLSEDNNDYSTIFDDYNDFLLLSIA